MDRQAFLRSREEAEKASQEIAAIRNAKTLSEVADHWSDFLTHIQRAYTKLRISYRKGPSKGWCDQIFSLRDSDDLLKYVHQARHADEHGVERITEQKEGRIAIGPKEGDSLEVDYARIGGGQVVMGPRMAANARVTITPGEVRLVPVRNRGVTYQVPKAHLGKDLESVTLLRVAELADAFLRDKLNEADGKFSSQ
jgi:hypothetical protein